MKWSIFVCLLVCLTRFCEGVALRCPPGVVSPSCIEEKTEADTQEPSRSESTEAQCLVGTEWESNCHYCRCSDSGVAECLKQNSCDKGIFAEPVLCKPNTTFQRDCNTCVCLDNGLGLCTLEFCRRSSTIKDTLELAEERENEPTKKSDQSVIVVPIQYQREEENLVEIDHGMLKRSTICKPHQEFMRDCNPCICAGDGQSYSCTKNECLDMNKEVEVFMESEGVDHIERHSVCRASHTFYIDCNTCRCNPLGTDYTCTTKRCPLPADVEIFHEFKVTRSATNSTKSQVCVANRMFMRDCNTCWCNKDGTSYACTRKTCVPLLPDDVTETPVEISKSVKNETKAQVCVANRMFIKDCNTCVCNEDGTGYACTRKTCVPLLPDEVDLGGIPAEELRETKKECRPDEVFQLDCNTCRCNPDGKSFVCTRRACEESLDKKKIVLSRKVRSFSSQDSPKACQPGQEFRMDCNKCLCDNKGQDFSCTRIDCNALNNNHEIRSKRQATASIDMKCVAGSVFDRDCNVCRCTSDGEHAVCTLKRCTQNNEVDSEQPPDSDPGFRCNPGEQFKRECNDCTCSADGKSVFCTLRLCDETRPADDILM